MRKEGMTRREFIRGAASLAGGLLMSPVAFGAQAGRRKRTAVDQVRLGRTGLRLSRLGIGTGSIGGSIQRNLGQEKFTELIQYTYDQGITYIDTADAYRTHTMVREAIKGLPREKLFIQSKMGKNTENPLETLDRFRKELGVEYIDSLLIHCTVKTNWDDEQKKMMDALEQAKEKKIILAHGTSCHSLPALTRAAELEWVDVNLVRINPQGSHMDTPGEQWNAKSNESHVSAVVEQIKVMRKNRHGIIGMKLIGEGNFTEAEDREKSIRFAMQPRLLHAAVIGFKNPAEVDEAIKRMNSALAEAT
jgi:predicted aldo/keto reductase-like oxidoreductase